MVCYRSENNNNTRLRKHLIMTHRSTVKARRPRIDPHYSCYRLVIRRSSIHGLGVFAAEQIPRRRKVIEYTGELISNREANRRVDRAVGHFFALNNHRVLDGLVGGSGAEYVNHSCNPNLYSRLVKDHVLYFSQRGIMIGEELSVDYRYSLDEIEVACHCDSRNCRRMINTNMTS